VAAKTPEKLFIEYCPVLPELPTFKARNLAFALDLEGDLFKSAIPFFKGLYKAFVEKDCSLIEVNPMIVTTDGILRALDAKVNFDDNALFKHPDILELRDLDEEDPKEVDASKYSLNYINLNGKIGCLVNGAGLAMATMDTIKLHGGEPANFLDVGGSATTNQVREAFRIITQDSRVKAILVNIFGGIMKCDVVAEGIIEATKQIKLNVPLIVKLEGTNADRGNQLLKESGLPIITATDMDDAAKKAVGATGGRPE
jgi:succinyl-CoA synthetase beta subunit